MHMCIYTGFLDQNKIRFFLVLNAIPEFALNFWWDGFVVCLPCTQLGVSTNH